MEKLKVLLLILGGLIFVVWRLVQKARDMTQREQRERPPATGQPVQTTSSFEELLQQMQQQNERGNKAPEPARTPGGREMPHEQARAARTLEQPATRALSQERRAKNMSLERPAPLARRGTGMDHSQPANQPRQQKPLASAAATARRSALNARLRSPAELREAFILSEILKRKFE